MARGHTTPTLGGCRHRHPARTAGAEPLPGASARARRVEWTDGSSDPERLPPEASQMHS